MEVDFVDQFVAWPPTGPPPLPARAAVELVRRVRVVGAATVVARR